MPKLIGHQINQAAYCEKRMEDSYLINIESHEKKENIYFEFTVKAKPQYKKLHLFTNKDFNFRGFKNWGLWNYDVVECFVTFNKSKCPYLEVQLSPLGQIFALIINEPRQKFSYPDSSFTVQVDSDVSDNTWNSIIGISKSNIPGFEPSVTAQKLYGNFFSILGEKREYYGLNINQEKTPDFHCPELFEEIKLC